MNEIWKPIIGYENYYEISNGGEVRRIKHGPGAQAGRVLKGSLDSDGYINIGLTVDGKQKWFRIHRLVAQTFIENPKNKPQVNHINGIKNDNRVENLEWCTQEENMQHARQTGLLRDKSLKGPTAGRIAVTNEGVSFFISPEDFTKWESKGYRRGRNKYRHLRVNEGKGL